MTKPKTKTRAASKRTRAKATPKTEAPTGRPRLEIDVEQVRKMASFGCTTAEIAAVMRCSPDTLERRCRTELVEGREARNGNLRVLQFKLAEKSAAMAIFLGKNYLGQRDVFGLERMNDDDLLALARAEGIVVGATVPATPGESGEDEVDAAGRAN